MRSLAHEAAIVRTATGPDTSRGPLAGRARPACHLRRRSGKDSCGRRSLGDPGQARTSRFQPMTSTPSPSSRPICQIQRGSRRRDGAAPWNASQR